MARPRLGIISVGLGRPTPGGISARADRAADNIDAVLAELGGEEIPSVVRAAGSAVVAEATAVDDPSSTPGVLSKLAPVNSGELPGDSVVTFSGMKSMGAGPR